MVGTSYDSVVSNNRRATSINQLVSTMHAARSEAITRNVQVTLCPSGNGTTCTDGGNWGGGWIYAPDYLPTGESLFATGAGANSGSYSDPTMDRLIKASQQQSGTQPLYDYQDYAMQQLPVIYQANAYAVTATSTHVGGVVYNPLLTLTPEYWYRTK